MESYSCSACNAKFKSQQELDKHVEREHEAKREPAKTGQAEEKR